MSFIYSQALMSAYERCTSLREPVEAFSGGNCSDTDACAPLSGSHTPRPCLSHDRTMDVSRLSRFGMTCRPLTDDLGAALLTSWLAGFHAKTSASPERAQESTGSDLACGPTWRASLAKFDPVSCSWKTVQLSLLGDSELSSVIWPRSGMTADGQCWELPTLERRTSETVFGCLVPTPISNDALKRGDFNPVRSWGLAGFAKMFPTPVASDTTMRSKPYAQGGTPLSLAVKLWPTPTSTLGTNGGLVTPNKAREGGTLIEALSARTMWRTPNSAVVDPKSSVTKLTGRTPSDPQVGLADQVGGKLNPMWVEWLMGWPIGWTALKPSETAKSPNAQLQHGECSEGSEA